MRVLLFIIVVLLTLSSCSFSNSDLTTEEPVVNSSKQLQTFFVNPPVEYRSAPLWVWNDDITESQIDRQLKDFQEEGIGGVFIHPRPGLITPYLSARWFDLCRYTVEKSKEMGMDVWLYDENSYPSGFAGGHVPAEMPQSFNEGGGLRPVRFDTLPEKADRYFLVLKSEHSKFIDITDKLSQEKGKSGDYYLYKKTHYKNQAWHGGFSYVDLLHKGVTDKFIELTMTGYKKAIGDEFGKTVKGIFTDEPNISPPGGLRWTPDLFKEFEKRNGYDLKTNLPSIDFEIGEWKRVRHDYYATLLEMFIERWSKPWHEYTEKNMLDWTGHYWEHGWPNPVHGGDNMAMYAWHQMPAIDILMNKYSEDVNAQFGNVRSVKELRSVANQMGKPRTLSETYGAGGWDLRFEDMKRIGDWEFVLGVNFLNQHLSYMTIEGARKKDHPQSFSYHEPWWKFYKSQGDYFARLSLAMSAGQQINRVLVIEPTTTAWMYYSKAANNNRYSVLGNDFQKFLLFLEKNQIEYDLASENIMKDIARVKGDKFIVGKRSYNIVIIPPGLENVEKPTFSLMKRYLKDGGRVVSYNGVPRFVNGVPTNELTKLAEDGSVNWLNANYDEPADSIFASQKIHFQKPETIKGKLFHHRRELADGQILFLVNTSNKERSAGRFTIKGRSVKEMDALTGKVYPYHFEVSAGMLDVSFDLPPVGSLLLLIGDEDSENVQPETVKTKIIEPSGSLDISVDEPNVLTLDFCDLTINGKTEKGLYYYNAADKIFRHYGFNGNPWHRAVQYKTTIVDRDTFPQGSGFEVSYPFTVDVMPDRSTVKVVAEHPELWDLSINGKPVTPNVSEHWLDRKFAVYDIGENIKQGVNSIKLVANKMSVYAEVESVYLLGNFGLKSKTKGWAIVSPSKLKAGSWKEQGYPFYSWSVSYSNKYLLNNSSKEKRYIVKLPYWNGSVAEVKVNGEYAGIIAWPPYELDITDKAYSGESEISVSVYGSLKNLLGPHHSGHVRGSAWPAAFVASSGKIPPGDDYDLIDYGLFQDFLLIESVGTQQKEKRYQMRN